MTIKNRAALKSYFVKNAIPTEGNFADLIDSQLNQAQDGVFKLDGDALSVVAAGGDQRRVLRLYANYPAANPDWMISLNPAPAGGGVGSPGFGITDSAGKTRLFIDAPTGRVGIGTTAPGATLDVNGDLKASSVLVAGHTTLTDRDGKFDCYFPYTDNSSYVSGNTVVLRGGVPDEYKPILTATAKGGTVSIAGNLGTHGFSPTTQLPKGWIGGVNTRDVVAHGKMWSVQGYRSGPRALAERFADHEPGLEPGDVVALDPDSPERVIRSNLGAPMGNRILGVITTDPGFELGCDLSSTDGGVSVAIAGRVPVKVNMQGGPIRIGDFLTTSDTPGFARVAPGIGRVLGLALSAFDDENAKTGTVTVFVNPHYHNS